MVTLLNSLLEGGETVETATRWQSSHGHVGLSQSRAWSWPCPEEERIASLEHQPTSKDTSILLKDRKSSFLTCLRRNRRVEDSILDLNLKKSLANILTGFGCHHTHWNMQQKSSSFKLVYNRDIHLCTCRSQWGSQWKHSSHSASPARHKLVWPCKTR